jgi:hypothetical protein
MFPRAAMALAVLSAGCVRLYQPLSGLHRPIVVDPQADNLPDVRLTVHCIPGEAFSQAESSVLCQRVGRLFENQGAQVRTLASARAPTAEDTYGDGGDRPRPVDLTLELRSREEYLSNYPLSWLACIASFTIVPGVSESTFVMDVGIRDGSGFLLANDSLKGRLITRFGAGVWVGNKLLDVTRKRPDRITGDAFEQDLSSDLYGQLSQLVFNARMRATVLIESAP